MADDSDLMTLYSTRVLALAADMPRCGRLAAPDATGRARAPLCGSTVTVDLALEGGRIADYRQEVRACALGQAAASVVGGAIIGCTRDDVARARDELAGMLGGGAPPQAPFDGLAVLAVARDHRNRHASILLALDATLAALDTAAARKAE
ncbi:MAG: iron-sulfur cluster assembly scaffold protein [Rubellimicrobium sp.]|nr:iron-sulfur cluster assembly scaffold protein [Rubellimicrobium sp.]